MKKIFTLIATALMAVSANAQDQTIASWNAGETVGTWTALGTATWTKDDGSNYTSKYNSNGTTTVCMTFGNSYSKADDGTPTNCVRVEGDFKRGDVITLQPFTAMSNADFTGGSKYANIEIRDAASKALFNTNGTAEAKTVTDGHEEAGDPKEFTYTLTSDMSAIYFGRSGNTRINIMKIVITRGNGDVIIPRTMTGNVIDDSKTWICPQDKARNDELSDGVTLWEGIYLRGNTGSQAIKVEEDNVTVTMGGEEITVSKVFSIASNQNLAPAADASADVAYSNATRMSIAINVGVAGKLYVCMRAASLPDPARYAWIYRNGEKAFEKSTADWKTKDVDGTTKPDFEIIEVENNAEGATYFIGGHIGLRVAAIKFVKDGTSGIKTVETARQNDGKWYNLAGQEVAAPSKGIFIKNGHKYIVK